MNCPKCNHPYEVGQKFCAACGNPLSMQAEDKCPKCQSKIRQNQKFCSICGHDLQQPIPTVNNVKLNYATPIIDNNTIGIICPECGKVTNSLKQATLFNKLLFLMIYTQWQTVTYTCCPECMRKHIAKRSAITLFTGNLIWPIVALPLHGYHLYKSYQPGHSKSVIKAIQP